MKCSDAEKRPKPFSQRKNTPRPSGAPWMPCAGSGKPLIIYPQGVPCFACGTALRSVGDPFHAEGLQSRARKELDTLFKGARKPDQRGQRAIRQIPSARHGSLHKRILRSRRKTLELLAKQQINTGMLCMTSRSIQESPQPPTNSWSRSRRAAEMMKLPTGDYHTAVKFTPKRP